MSSKETVKLASAKKRFIHFVVDYWLVPVLIAIILVFLSYLGICSASEIEYLTVISTFFYLLLTELLFSKTLGKLLTKTIVVSTGGGKVHLWQILVRTIARYIALFEVFTVFDSNPVVFHDFVSKTRVVEDGNNPRKKKDSKVDKKQALIKILVIVAILLSFYKFIYQGPTANKNSLKQASKRPNSWTKYELENAKFVVKLPSRPDFEEEVVRINDYPIHLKKYTASEGEEQYLITYADVRSLFNEKYYQDCSKLAEDSVFGFEKDNCEMGNKRSREMKKDIYDYFFHEVGGLREMEKINDNFQGNNTYDFLWRDTNRDVYVKGKVIIKGTKDLFILRNENSRKKFSNWEQFIYSLESFGELS